MSQALRRLALQSLSQGGEAMVPGAKINDATLPEAGLVFHADFAPVSADFFIPGQVRLAWSSPSGGEAGLVPVFSGGEVVINGGSIQEQVIIFYADFAPLSGGFVVPSIVQEAWSSPSGGEAGLVPVYAGDA